MATKRATQDELLAQIREWNRRYPVGTEVNSTLYPDRLHKTRTEAVTLFDQKAVIYLEGFNGYFDLGDVNPTGQVASEARRSEPARNDPAATPAAAPAANAAPAATPVAAPESSPPPAVTPADKRIVVLFPGQGAQSKGMGKDLFPAFPQETARASELLGYSIERLCLEDPDSQLNLTQYTQPALYVVNALGYLARKAQNDPAVEANAFMGHSLGEYNALLAAGVFDFETGLRLVIQRGVLMGEASGGAMAAVVRVNAERIRRVLDEAGLDAIDLANFNTPTQTVISGPAEAMAKAQAVFEKEKILAMPLKVSAAFHSRYMREAQQSFAKFLADFHLQPPQCSVIANATALPYEADAIAATLAEQIASPVLWTDSVRYAESRGEVQFTEIGSNILSKMIKDIRGR